MHLSLVRDGLDPIIKYWLDRVWNTGSRSTPTLGGGVVRLGPIRSCYLDLHGYDKGAVAVAEDAV